MRPEPPHPTLTTRTKQSLQQGLFTFATTTTTYPRPILIGGKAVALTNPLPTITGCSGACHEAHSAILEKNLMAEGYISIRRPMSPNCLRDSLPDDPIRSCHQR